MKFTFGDIVVVNETDIGVVVKCFTSINENGKKYNYDVYVRLYNSILNYKEDDIQRYMVRHKELSEKEQQYQYNAMHGL